MTYEVGYGKPPKDKQFQLGHCPHNKGRPRESVRDSAESAELYNAIRKIKCRKVAALIRGKTVKIPGLEALLNQLFNEAIRGNVKSRELFFKLVEKADLAALNGQAGEHIHITIEGGLPDE